MITKTTGTMMMLGILSILSLVYHLLNGNENILFLSRSLRRKKAIKNIHVEQQIASDPHYIKTQTNPSINNFDMKNNQLTHSAIHIPSDMWKNPLRDPSWSPIDLPTCCNGPLQSLFTCKRTKSPLRYVGPGTGLTPYDLQVALQRHKGDLILLGDSLTMQWFVELACYLGAGNWNGWDLSTHRNGWDKSLHRKGDDLEKRITELLVKFKPAWRKRVSSSLGSFINSSGFGHFEVPSLDPNTSTKQRVIFHALTVDGPLSNEENLDLLFFYDKIYPREFSRDSPIFVINHGLHYNAEVDPIDLAKKQKKRRKKHRGATSHYHEANFPSDLRKIYELMSNACQKGEMKCIFRETTPQHFKNPDGNGLYKNVRWMNKGCMILPPKSFETLDGWRNEILHSVMDKVENSNNMSGKSFVKIMPLFDKLVYLSFAHGKSTDCTHFARNPEYWEPWHVSLTQVLQELLVNALPV